MSDRPDAEFVPTEVRIRRAPRLGVFIGIGAVLGFFATLTLTSLFPSDPNVGFAASFGYFLVFGVPIGAALGAAVGLTIDAVSRRRARTVTAERETFDAPPREPDPETPPAADEPKADDQLS